MSPRSGVEGPLLCETRRRSKPERRSRTSGGPMLGNQVASGLPGTQ